MSIEEHPLYSYKMAYEITALPYTIFAQLVSAAEPLEFKESFYIPEEIRMLPVECRFTLFSPSGEVIELASQMVPASMTTIKAAVNVTPLKMIDKLLRRLLSE